MHALVTGGGGFLGLYIVEQLLAVGHQVRVFCRGDYPALRRPGITVVRGDVRDAEAVRTACESVDCVFHTSAVIGVWGPWAHYYSINTVGTRNVIEACRFGGVRRLIYTSSPSVVFDGQDHRNAEESLPYPTSWLCHYPHSKALAEQAVLAANTESLKTVSLRPHLIWGPRDNHLIPRLIQRAKSGRLRRIGNGNNEVSVSYVENAAAAHLQAEASLRTSDAAAGKAYFVNDPEPVNLWNWINELLSRVSISTVSKSISKKSAWRTGAAMELLWKVLPGEPPMTRFVAAQLAGSHSYRIAAAQRDFGYAPPFTMEEGLQKLSEDPTSRLV